MRREVIYFEKPGERNTDACVDVLVKLAGEGYKHFVIASTSGRTGLLAAKGLKGFPINLVIVGHSVGFKAPNTDEFLEENYKAITSLGGKVYKGTMLTHSLETSLAKEFSGVYPTLLIAQTLRRFGQGIKVCCEIVMEAADAGLIPEGEEVVAMAGTVKGADTVAIIKSATSKRFLSLKVLEILAKPRG